MTVSRRAGVPILIGYIVVAAVLAIELTEGVVEVLLLVAIFVSARFADRLVRRHLVA